jgi:hypothetical protein
VPSWHSRVEGDRSGAIRNPISLVKNPCCNPSRSRNHSSGAQCDDAFFSNCGEAIGALALRYRVPAIFQYTELLAFTFPLSLLGRADKVIE